MSGIIAKPNKDVFKPWCRLSTGSAQGANLNEDALGVGGLELVEKVAVENVNLTGSGESTAKCKRFRNHFQAFLIYFSDSARGWATCP